jgi:hypothetical protein
VALLRVMTRVRAFLRAGYPVGAPGMGYAPLMALMPRRPSVDEWTAAAAEVGPRDQRPLDGTNAAVAITKQTNELPHR